MREDVQYVTHPARIRVGQMEASPVETGLVRDVVHRIDHVVHRHQVEPAALDADSRHPRRKQAPQLLDRLEEVVGPVDLVHLAGARIADHDARAIDAPRPPALSADDAFGLMLGAEIRVLEVLRLLEHVFAEHALVQPGGSDRAGQMEAADFGVVRKLDGVKGALHIGNLLGLGAGLEVVDRREVEHVVDLTAHPTEIYGRDAHPRLRQIAHHRYSAFRSDSPARQQRFHRSALLTADQEIQQRAFSLEELLGKARPDKAGRAGDEVTHERRSLQARGCRSSNPAARSGKQLQI